MSIWAYFWDPYIWYVYTFIGYFYTYTGEGGQEAATFALLSVLEGEEKKSTWGQISKYSPSKYLIKQRGGDQKAWKYAYVIYEWPLRALLLW